MIVGARFKSRAQQVVETAWQFAAFSRTEKLKPLAHYLEAGEREADPDKGAQDLRDMIGRMQRR